MNKILSENLAGYYAGECQSSHGLAILPLFRHGVAAREYVSLRQGLQQGAVVISEVHEGGSVPNLKVVNKGLLPVLILDGEELRGAKQNRVLNASVLIPAESEQIIPVSCTEAGRWHYQGRQFEESGNVMPSRLKQCKMASVTDNLHYDRGFKSDQGQVWDGIDRMQEEHDSRSRTSAMSDVYQNRAVDLDEFCRSFPLLEGQCGIFAFGVDAFMGIDLVSRPEVWADLHAKLVRSYAIDTLGTRKQAGSIDKGKLEELFQRLAECRVDSFKSVGLGDDLRLAREGLIGSALLWESEIVHLAAYPTQTIYNQEDRYHSPRHRWQ